MLAFHYDNKKADARVHGNGFIQAELADGSKMHIWTKDCPRQEVPTLIHNHTSPFSSTILYGYLRNEEYGLGSSPTPDPKLTLYTKYQAVTRNKKDTVLEEDTWGGKFWLATTRKFYFSAGSTYQFPGTEDLFHATYPETDLVVTRVFRQPEEDRSPIILVKDGEKPDNNFDRYEHQEYGEEIYLKVRKMLRVS